MDVSLIVEKGTSRVRTVRLHLKHTVVGRSADCNLCIKSAQISRRHCLLSADAGRVTVKDLGSVNGTFVNGKRVGEVEHRLRPGDTLEIGPLRFTVEYEEAGAALEKATRLIPVAEPADLEEVDVEQDRDTAVVPLVPVIVREQPPQPAPADDEPITFNFDGQLPWAVVEDDDDGDNREAFSKLTE